MARDYTKYLINNNSTPLSKRALALEIVRFYNVDKKPTYNKIKEIFPDELQGSKGFIIKKSLKYDPKRFHEEALTSADKVQYLVSNQWGSKNISGLLKKGEALGIYIKEFNKTDNQKKVIYSTSQKHYYKEDGNFGKDGKTGGLKTVTKHDDNGNLIESLHYDREKELWKKMIYKYNSKNNLSESTSNELGNYKYDSFGNFYKEDNKVKFDSKGRLQQKEWFYSTGELMTKSIYEYNNDGCIINAYSKDDYLKYYQKKDNKNKIIECKKWKPEYAFWADFKGMKLIYHRTYKYEYDTMNNWIKKTCYQNDELHEIVERKIEYS